MVPIMAYTAAEVQGFGQVLADSIRTRIQSGQNIYDQSAALLRPGLAGRRRYPISIFNVVPL